MGRPPRILLVRTFLPLKGGGPVPPTGLLYVAGALRASFPEVTLRVVDMGLEGLEAEGLVPILEDFRPDLVGLGAMSCEAPLLHRVAAVVRRVRPGAWVVVGGAHATAAPAAVIRDPNVDVVVRGEAEETVVELVATLDRPARLADVAGLTLRDPDGAPRHTPDRPPILDLDRSPGPAWDLVDLRAYGGIPNWNGIRKAPFHAPVVSSRGCPYRCVFCHHFFGRTVRFRSPESVLAELRMLHDRYGVREFHFVDDVFNVDAARAGRICDGILASGMKVALAFPNGLRADLLTPELVRKLEQAGTYKIHFGFETSSPRLQREIGKDLDVERALAAFRLVSRTRIIAGAYFMLGLPTETEEEARGTIECAARSDLDVAYFFKTTMFPGDEGASTSAEQFGAHHFHSTARSNSLIPEARLNALLLEAQHRFWLVPRRLWRSFRKAPSRMGFLRFLLDLSTTLLHGWLLRRLLAAAERRRPVSGRRPG